MGADHALFVDEDEFGDGARRHEGELEELEGFIDGGPADGEAGLEAFDEGGDDDGSVFDEVAGEHLDFGAEFGLEAAEELGDFLAVGATGADEGEDDGLAAVLAELERAGGGGDLELGEARKLLGLNGEGTGTQRGGTEGKKSSSLHKSPV